jgi:multidrug resistance efflux pump
LAQRIPVHISIDDVPQGVRLVAGITATVRIASPSRHRGKRSMNTVERCV